MSELIQKNDNRATIRWKLLTGASALVLTAYVSSVAKAEDASRPQIWIELGGELNRLADAQETFSPVFPSSPARPAIFSPSEPFERPARFGLDEFAKISFQPKDSDWVFSAAIRYGRSTSKRHVHQQTYPATIPLRIVYQSGGYYSFRPWQAYASKFSDTRALQSERHTILDFQAGKDLGLGMFGNAGASSVLSAGIRFAQFAAKSNIAINSDPDAHFSYKYNTPVLQYFGVTRYVTNQTYHLNSANLRASRSFRGVGPSLSWNASLPFAGNTESGQLSVDWGIDVAALFGRQKAKVHHDTTVRYGHADGYNTTYVVNALPPVNRSRSRSIMVPNVGGSVGLSWQLPNFKMSLGYRADFFFGAIDGGIDTRKNENRGFYGPFASISIGLGD